VARFLSEAWFDDVAAMAPIDDRTSLTLQQVVTDAPEGEVRYHVRVSEGRAAIYVGQAARPDATFTEDYATAAAVARGELSVQAALLAGRIRIGGNMATLSRYQEDLAGMDPIPAAVRATTSF
jgi:putative sterol carrier protein